ncbi:MAG: hypothetical protein LUE06_10305, partial [Oscillospiraceae bacterium]|nr:hypothetical protein [Oscillospiraceae bacterium]
MRTKRDLFHKLTVLLLCAVLFPAAGLTALAADTYDFVLYANGANTATVEVGDAVEITLAIEGGADYTFYSMQDYVKFDTEFFALDEDSISVKQQQNAVGTYDDLFSYAPILSGDTYDRVFVNRASLTGVAFAAEETILTFTLTARKAGTTDITHYRTEMLDSEGAGMTVNEYSATVTIADDSDSGGSGGGSSGGSSGGTSSYAVNVRSAENGTVTSSHSVAARGATVTLTVSPDAGYALD